MEVMMGALKFTREVQPIARLQIANEVMQLRETLRENIERLGSMIPDLSPDEESLLHRMFEATTEVMRPLQPIFDAIEAFQVVPVPVTPVRM
jgi:hypothetical protein